MKKNNKNSVSRKTVLVFVVLSIFFVLVAKLIYIQIFLHDKISHVVKRMVNREDLEIPKRGDITDAKGKILATSIKKYMVFIDPRMVENFDEVKKVLSENGIKICQNKITDFGNTFYVPVAFGIDVDVVDKIRRKKFKSIGFKNKYIRCYPEGRLLSHILGVTDSDGRGLEGIEKVYNGFLSGNSITTKMHRDGCGRIIQNKIIDQLKICGQNVELSIDRTVQFIAEQELRFAFEKYKAKKAICIVQNPKTGCILAMVSLPDFDSSDKIKDVEILRNSAISDIYEPGSTFKIVTVASALEKGKIKPSDVFYLENGKLKIAGHTIKDDHKVEGMASLSKVMELSSNIAMVKIAQKLGSEDFYEYIRKFGFYSLTGIDLPGEAKGLLMDVKKWNALTLPTISFGQGIGVTALQIINAFSVIANDGVLKRPFVVQRIEKLGTATEVFESKETKIRTVISAETAQIVKKLLKNAVDSGTGQKAKIKGYTVGGKTGTAQKVDPASKTYSTRYYNASFCGMVPAMDPEFVVLVIIDEPKGSSYYSSSVAAPVFSKIAKRIAEYFGLEKDDVNQK